MQNNTDFSSSHNTPTLHSAPNLLHFSTLSHAFFGRRGGVSPPPLDSLNGTLKDTDQNRHQNQSIVCKALGAPLDSLQRLHQVHGNTIHIVEKAQPFHKIKEGDGLITCHKNVPLAVITADCLPIFLYEPAAQIIGVLHAGWRGIAANILEKAIRTIEQLGGASQNLHVAIGPHIHQKNYEVGPEVRAVFLDQNPLYENAFQPNEQKTDNAPKFLLSLKKLISHQLNAFTLASTWISEMDTYAHPEQFFSCRYAAHHVQNRAYGCQFSAIMQTH